MAPRNLIAALCAGAITLAACGGGGSSNPAAPTPGPSPSPAPMGNAWELAGDTWRVRGGAMAPACASPLTFSSPVDLSRATSILYPGQVRGGDYKAHGGVRFGGGAQTTQVNVTAPMDGYLNSVARYRENGEIQYIVDFIHECGIRVRFDHLLELTPRFQMIAERVPLGGEGESRGYTISGAERVAAGELIATRIGLSGNIGVDFGVYDLRAYNAAAASPAWRAQHPGEYAAWGICWLDHLPGGDSARARSLPPGDFLMGRTSDYCR